MMKKITVFTPSYNRKHTIHRTFASLLRQTSKDFDWLIVDDGSTDGTRQWVESLGKKVSAIGSRFDWMGRCIEGSDENHFILECERLDGVPLHIEYVYKPNGGLYSGYNVAYNLIHTELNVCIDSDDYMPDNAVELIIDTWRSKGNSSYAGIIGLDFFLDGTPIGGYFNEDLHIARLVDIYQYKLHQGDIKCVLRTDLMREVAPQIGFEGEKNFNPVYMQLIVDDKYPSLILNENLCFVEYQESDSMSKAIYRQYVNSARSFAKLRLLEMSLSHSTFKNKFRCAMHYVSSCIFSKDRRWLQKSTAKVVTLLAVPFGLFWYLFVCYKNRE